MLGMLREDQEHPLEYGTWETGHTILWDPDHLASGICTLQDIVLFGDWISIGRLSHANSDIFFDFELFIYCRHATKVIETCPFDFDGRTNPGI